jgi:predicted NBD/HSP70 family sugar kinase
VNNPDPDVPVLLGFECGGTRTVAIAATPDLVQQGRVEGGPANRRLISDTGLGDLLRHLSANLPPPSAIGVGMAGVRDATDIQRVLAILDGIWPGVPARVDHDLESALSAAGLDLPGDDRSHDNLQPSPILDLLSGDNLRVAGAAFVVPADLIDKRLREPPCE